MQDARSIILNRSPRWLWAGALAVLCAFRPVGAPADEAYHRYWGDVHGHTILSDGEGTVADYFQSMTRTKAKAATINPLGALKNGAANPEFSFCAGH